MKVAFCMRGDYLARYGGDTCKVLNAKEVLEGTYGVKVSILTEPQQLYMYNVDIVHVFNAQTLELSLQFAEVAKSLGKKVVLSSIFWDLSHSLFASHLARLGIMNIKKWHKFLKKPHDLGMSLISCFSSKVYFGSSKYVRNLNRLVTLADLVITNSPEELDILKKVSGVRNINSRVVINEVNTEIFRKTPKIGNNMTVLTAGRIEPTKNQLSLVRSLLEDKEIRIVIVGAVSSGRYLKEIEKLARIRGNVEIIPRNVSQSELYDIYVNSDVHALPSFRDSPGRTTLEALSVGLKVVVSGSDFCPVDFYFGKLVNKSVFVCNPYDISSIRTAVLRALKAPADEESSEFPFTLERKGLQIFEAYKDILSVRG